MTEANARLSPAQRLIAVRRRREMIFPGIEEAGWMVLLDLYSSDGRDISVTSACLASFAPSTTALRHVGLLEADGMVFRERDPGDGRRAYLRLTELARNRLAEFFTDPAHHPSDQGTDALRSSETGGAFVPFHSSGVEHG